jgi:transglutaminase-like putative cysteine protease
MKNNLSLNKLRPVRLEEGWLSLLALVVAFMTVIWSVEGAQWTEGVWILPRIAIPALALGVVLAKVRFVPGLLSHSFMLSVGMVLVGVMVFPFVGVQYVDDDWTKKLGGVVLRVVKWGERTANGAGAYDSLVFLVGLGILVWISGYAVSWLVFRRHQVWLAITIMAAILMVNLSYNPPNPLGSFSVFLISSLLLVVRISAFQNEERWRRLRIPYRREFWRGVMAVGTVLVMLITMIAFALPSSSQVEPLGNVLSKVNGPWQQLDYLPGFGSSPNNGPQREGRLPTNYNNLGKSFTIGGPITLSNEPVLRVKGDDPKYLQVAAMDLYDGKGWQATYQDPTPGQNTDKVLNQLSLAAGQALPTSTDQGRAMYRLTVTPLIPGFTPVLTTGELVSVDRSALLAYHWERIVINSQLNRIVPKQVADGNGGWRTVVVDENSGQPVPPDLLPLINLLKKAQEQGGGGVGPAPALTFSSQPNGNGYYISGGSNSARSATPQDAPGNVWEVNGWIYKLPSKSELQALNLQPGGARDQSGRLQIQLSEKSQPDKVYTVPATGVYLSTQGSYTFGVNTSSLNGGDAVKTRFETSDSGQKIKAEVDRLGKEVPGNTVSYEIRNGVPFALKFDGYQPNYDDLMASTTQKTPEAGESYTTEALRYRADEQSLRKAGTSYPTWVKNRYLELPETVPQRVKDLAASLTAGLSNPYDKAKAIESYLRTIPYSLNAPFTPEDRDPVDFFLFDSKTGYCVHYSTALNVMLRSLGIPTREMTGFNGGEFDSASGTSIVRASAAHAWTQVYFPGYGWIDFEPTPNGPAISRPQTAADVQPLPTPTPEAVAVPAPVTPEAAPADQANNAGNNGLKEQDEANNSAASTSSKQENGLLLWLGGVLGLLALCFAVYQGNQWWLRSQLRLPDVTPMAVYQRMLKTAHRAGLKPRATMTPYEFSRYLGQNLPAVRGEVRAFTDGYVRQRYGPQMVEDELKREMAEVEAARARVAQAEAEGREPTQEELWQAFKSQSVLLHSSREIRDMWVSYQLGLIAYRRRRRLERFTPGFYRTTYRYLVGVRRRVRHLFKKKS